MRRTMVGSKCLMSVAGPAGAKCYTILRLLALPRFLMVFVLALIVSPAMHGQATGSFSGNVLDKSGSAIPGATVTATSQGTGLARNTQTDPAGHYLIPLLPVGTYTVRVEAVGFQTAESKDLRLQVTKPENSTFRSRPPPSSPTSPLRPTPSLSRPPIPLSARSSTRSRWRSSR